jgi:hypothetical protein
MQRRIFVAGLGAFLFGCSPIRQETAVSRPAGVESFASIGDVMVRIDASESLPNAFGKADIFGRTRDRGFSELRFMGLAPNGVAVFRRRDVDIMTNETTMSRTGFGSSVATAQATGQGVIVSGVTTQAPAPNVAVLPPDTTEFALDLRQGHIITIRDRVIEILDANPSGIRFTIRQ